MTRTKKKFPVIALTGNDNQVKVLTGADDGTRTHDLILTNDETCVLLSVFECHAVHQNP